MNLQFWTQIVPGVVVTLMSILVAWIVKQAVGKIQETIATKEFVVAVIKDHEATMMLRMTELINKASLQSITNADIEARMRRIEEAFNVRLRRSFDTGEEHQQQQHTHTHYERGERAT